MSESPSVNQASSNANGNEDSEIHGRILFVDDEENILTSLRRLMRKHPVECFFATSGQAGLDILQTEKIDLIVSDMRMPNMNGAEFLAKCKERWPKIVRILLTGHSDLADTINALNKGGIFRYLNKPWDDQELVESVEQGLHIRRLEKEKLSLLLLTKQQNEKLASFNESLEKKFYRVRKKSNKLLICWSWCTNNSKKVMRYL